MIDEIRALGCEDEGKIMMAHQTYLELNELNHLSDVTCFYSSELDLLYLIAEKNGTKSVYVPIHTSFNFSLSWVLEVQSKLSEQDRSIVLVIRDGDSSSVRYSLTQGLVPPSVVSNRKVKLGESSKKIKLSDSVTEVE